jgi:CSLREA domain-containing protein
MKFLKSVPSLVLLAVILLATVPIPSASVSADAVINVNTASDEDVDNATCSLREAIIAANTDTAYNGCTAGSGTDTITFAEYYTITLGSQLPVVTSPIIINGHGPAASIIQASTCNPRTRPDGCSPATYRVFEVGNSGDLTLDSVAVRHGFCRSGCVSLPANGGGILNEGGTLTVTNSTIHSNASDRGGGIYNNGGMLTITDSHISENHSLAGGGGMFNNNGASALTNTTFSNNFSVEGGGGVLNSNSTSTLTNITFSNNTVFGVGGGMYNRNSDPILTTVTFSENHSMPGYGGGMYNESSSPTLTDVTFRDNSAHVGGGMNNNNSSPTLTNVTFSNNVATGEGGGMNNTNSNPTLTNVTFSDNSTQASEGSGGGMYNIFSNPILTNVTFSNNSAANGGGMYNESSSPTLTNTIIANSPDGGDCVNSFGDALNASSSNNLIEDASNACGLSDGLNGNIVGQDPTLGVLANNGGDTRTHALQTGSPAIDTGTNGECPATDQRGVIRPQGTHCDIGAFEYEMDAPLPSVTSITRMNNSPTSATSVEFSVTFSKSVMNVDINDFTLVINGVNGATITNVSGADDTYIVTVHTGSGNGTIRLSVPVTATITDLAGNPLSGLPFTSGEFYIIAKQPNKPIDIPTPPTPLQ